MANLSNINGKFLFTDGDFLLIGGATANSISATESGVAIKNSNAATLSLQNSATNGKNHTLWSNTDGSFNITDVGVATRFTIASGGDVYIPSGNVSIGNTSVYPSGSNTILQIYSVSVPRLKLQNSTTGTASTAGSSFYVTGDDLIINNGETSGVIQFEIGGGTPVMRMEYGGNIGIGTIFPTAKLQIESTSAGAATVAAFLVNSNVTVNTETRLAFAAHTNSDIATNRYSYISTINTSGSNGQDMIFATNATGASAVERMRIDSSGNVSIPKTDSSTYSSTTPVADLILSRKNTGNTNNETVGIRFDVTGWSGSTTGGAAIEAIQPSNASSADLAFLTRNAGTWGERLRIRSDGYIEQGIVGTSTNAYYFFDTIDYGDSGLIFRDNTSTNSGYLTYNHGLDAMKFGVNGTERMRVESDGTVRVKTGSIVVDTAGQGIYLGGTAVANNLDDYEEGTWTPQVYYQNSTDQANATNVVQEGKYTKIGNLVYVSFRLDFSQSGTPANDNIGVKNLPFAGANNHYGAGGNLVTTTSVVGLNFQLPTAGSTQAVIIDSANGGNYGNEFGTGSGKFIRGSFTYQA